MLRKLIDDNTYLILIQLVVVLENRRPDTRAGGLRYATVLPPEGTAEQSCKLLKMLSIPQEECC